MLAQTNAPLAAFVKLPFQPDAHRRYTDAVGTRFDCIFFVFRAFSSLGLPKDATAGIDMAHYAPPFEIHIHGEIPLRAEVQPREVQEALKPLWRYAGAKSLEDGRISAYEEEPGIQYDARQNLLRICWTVRGGEDFRQNIDDMCMNLNELAQTGTAIEVTFYDAEFDDEEGGDREEESRDDFMVVFVGPTPAAIMQVQRDLLVRDVTSMMERHFDALELTGVVQEIDRLFSRRFDALVESLELGRPPKGGSGSSGHRPPGGRNKPKHLH